MLDFLSLAVSARPDGLALIYGQERWTYAELNRVVRGVGGWLSSHDVRAGDHIGVLLPNTPDTVCVIHALARLGAVLVPLNTRLTPDELTYQVRQARCKLVICNADTSAQAERLPVPALAIDQTGDSNFTFAQTTREVALAEPQAIVFTSGTAGRPKGAVLTYGAQFWSATASAFRLGVLPDDRWLCPLPLYHVGGLGILMRSCLYGTAVVLHNGFEADRVNHALDEQAVTLASLVPTMLYRLLQTRTTAPAHLRLILLGGAAASAELVERAHALGMPVATTYGLSEACSQVATQTPEGTRKKPGSVGKALPFMTVQVVGEDGRSLPAGQPGEIVVSGPTLMQGYYQDGEATARALRADRLFTGDIGYLDDDGDLWVMQRRSDLIVSGGENVYPAEVEAALRQHPAVADACVVGVADAEWGQRVAAAVVLRAGQQADSAELTTFCRQHLAGYKVPRQIRFVEALPLTASGKVERRTVAAWLNET